MEIFKRIAKSLFGSSRSSKTKKTKKKNAAAKKPARKSKKILKRKPVKRTSANPKPSKSKGKKAKPKAKRSKRQPVMVKEALALLPVGEITHYFPHVRAAVIKVSQGEIREGDVLSFRGHTTNFKQSVESMQIDHKPINLARTGDEIGLRVKSRVRAADKVYKV